VNWADTGALGGTRTPNLLIRSQMLYPLSYERGCAAQSTARRGISVQSRRDPAQDGRDRVGRLRTVGLLEEQAKATYNKLYLRRSDVKTMTYSESRAHYAETLNSVVDDREEVVITRSGHEPVVIVALDDYESLKETAYLLRSPENARRLLASIDRLEHGGGAERGLAE
jgi:antitoxin YefM